MRKDVCFGVIALTWVLSAVLASPLAIFREYSSLTLEPGLTILVKTHTHTLFDPHTRVVCRQSCRSLFVIVFLLFVAFHDLNACDLPSQ